MTLHGGSHRLLGGEVSFRIGRGEGKAWPSRGAKRVQLRAAHRVEPDGVGEARSCGRPFLPAWWWPELPALCLAHPSCPAFPPLSDFPSKVPQGAQMKTRQIQKDNAYAKVSSHKSVHLHVEGQLVARALLGQRE